MNVDFPVQQIGKALDLCGGFQWLTGCRKRQERRVHLTDIGLQVLQKPQLFDLLFADQFDLAGNDGADVCDILIDAGFQFTFARAPVAVADQERIAVLLEQPEHIGLKLQVQGIGIVRKLDPRVPPSLSFEGIQMHRAKGQDQGHDNGSIQTKEHG